MGEHKRLLTKLSEKIDQHRAEHRSMRQYQKGKVATSSYFHHLIRWLTPNGGTMLLVIALITTAQVWAKR